MTALREVELKFDVDEAAAAALPHADLLRGVRARRQRLHAIYFDTPDHRLAERGMALRVRKEGRGWVQCLKAGPGGGAGLHARDEWEVPRPDASIDRAALAGTPLAALLRRSKAPLVAVFEVEMARTTWTLGLGQGNRVELAFDRGEVRHGRRRAPVRELEIESVAGDPFAVFDAAERLLGEIALRPSAVSKAQRGYALARGDKAQPVKAVPIDIDPRERVDAAARRIVAAALAQMQANERGACGRDDEYLHQFRVGLRRLRSALRLFPGMFDRGTARRVGADCRWLSRVTGEARDWDVFVATTLRELEADESASSRRALRHAAAERRREAHERVVAALASARFASFVLRFARWLASTGSGEAGDIREQAVAALELAHRKALRSTRGLQRMKARDRHRLRIRLKRLRYACHALASLFGRDRVRPYLEALSALQDILGRATDARVGMRLAKRLHAGAEFTRRARERLARRERENVREVNAPVRALHAAVPFWHDGGPGP